MKRRILISLMVISAASMLVIGGLAVFTGSGSSTGDVAAGTVAVEVTPDPLVFDVGSCSPMSIGDSCTESDAVATNTGTLDADITISLSQVESVVGCYSIAGTAAGSPLPDTTLSVAPGGTITPISVTVTLDNPGALPVNDCQGATTDVTVTADAIES